MPPATITVRRPVEWMDTDAAGIWHYTTALRYVEHAELELHRRLGIHEKTFGRAPRVRVEVDFISPVGFADEVDTTLTVSSVGRSSISYEAELAGPQGVIARARVVSVLVDAIGGGASAVPDDLREALAEGGSD